MEKLAPDLAAPPAVVAALISRVQQRGCHCFIDAGCGSGTLLLAVARACPGVQCHGLELAPTLGVRLRALAQQAGLANVTVHTADLRHVLDVVPAADFIFAYVGGAMHQALAIHLAARGFAGTLLSALYPCHPFEAVTSSELGELSVFEYVFPACAQQLRWDAVASIALAPNRSYSLLSRAITLFIAGQLAVQVQAPAVLQGCVAVHLGQPTAAIGQTLLLDVVVDTMSLVRPLPPTLVGISVSCNGQPLCPTHQLLVGYHPTETVELALHEPDHALLRYAQRADLTQFYQLLATYQAREPAVQQQHCA